MKNWYNIQIDPDSKKPKTKKQLYPKNKATAIQWWLRRAVTNSNYDNHYEYRMTTLHPTSKPGRHGGWEIYSKYYIK